MDLSYPQHFLHDINAMTPQMREAREAELIAWCKRFADGHANPKWAMEHMFELSRLLEMRRNQQ